MDSSSVCNLALLPYYIGIYTLGIYTHYLIVSSKDYEKADSSSFKQNKFKSLV